MLVLFSLYKIPEHTKLIYGDRNERSGYLGLGDKLEVSLLLTLKTKEPAGNFLYLDLSGDYMGIYISKDLLNCTLKICILHGVYIIPHIKIKII